MTDIDSAKKIVLGQFGKALNTDDVALGNTFVTDDFVWIYYEGPNHPDGRIIRGFKAACEAVVERANRLKSPIVFNESNEFPSGDKIFTTYRVSGEFFDTGPFDVRAIDIYSFRGDKICSKDTYWKIITC